CHQSEQGAGSREQALPRDTAPRSLLPAPLQHRQPAGYGEDQRQSPERNREGRCRGEPDDRSGVARGEHCHDQHEERRHGRETSPPSPRTRPWRRSDVLHALETADTVRLSRATLATVRRLKAALATGQRGPYVRVDGGAGAAAANYARREPLAAIDSTGPRRSGPGHGT